MSDGHDIVGARIRAPREFTGVEKGETGTITRFNANTGYHFAVMDRTGKEVEWHFRNFEIITPPKMPEPKPTDTQPYADYYTAVTEYSEEG